VNADLHKSPGEKWVTAPEKKTAMERSARTYIREDRDMRRISIREKKRRVRITKNMGQWKNVSKRKEKEEEHKGSYFYKKKRPRRGLLIYHHKNRLPLEKDFSFGSRQKRKVGESPIDRAKRRK